MNHRDTDLSQVPDNRFYISAHVTYFGELGGFYLNKRCINQLCHAPGDFSFAYPGWPDHHNIFWRDLISHLIAKLLAAIAIAESNGDCSFSVALSYNIFIKFSYNLGRRQICQAS